MTSTATIAGESRLEEVANSVSHGIGFLGAVAIAPALIVDAQRQGTSASLFGASVFAGTMILVYLASTVFHALPRSRAKDLMRTLDHVAIFLLIAGTYTPFTLGVLRGFWGWMLFGLVWAMAILGITLRVLGSQRLEAWSTGLYLLMGWVCLIAVRPMWLTIPPAGLSWLVAGGLAYTIGAGFYVAERMPFNHFVWHLFVLVGTACHAVAVWRYAA